MFVAIGMNREAAAMLKLCVLATTLVAVICAPLDKLIDDQPHVRVKRAGGEEAVLDTDGKRSLLGFKPEDVEQAEGDQSAVVHTEILPAEDTSAETDMISSPKQQILPDELVPTEPETQGESQMDEAVEEESEDQEQEPEDLTESEEGDLQKLMSTESSENDIAEDSADSEEASEDISSSSPPTGRYSKLLYDLYNPYAYGRRKREAAKVAAATAEDMMMGGGGDLVEGGVGGRATLRGPHPGGRRIKRDLNMDELRSLLKRGGEYTDDYFDYPEYPVYDDYANTEYNDNEPYYGDNQVLEDIPESELLAEEIAQEQGGYDYPEQEYPEYPEYEEALEEYYEPNQVYPEQVYPDYEQGNPQEYLEGYPEEYQGGYLPENDVDDMPLQEKLALMGYLEREEMEGERYNPYGEYEPRYPTGVEETYEDLGPAGQGVYKRQYLSFVPGSKRSVSDREFYPITDGWWRGLTDPLAEQKRNDMEYERLLRLAEALNGPYDDEEWRKK